ncbi:MAG TPA: O-antigen ligase family protein [Candidatus Aquicultor sp.]|jgi:putative inorganic carbon (HCO3(-)) transporter
MGKKQQHKQPAAKQQQSNAAQLDTWVMYGIMAIAIALPVVISRITFDQFDIAKILALRILTLVTLLCWAAKMFYSKKQEIRWSKLDFAVLGFLALVLISTITSVHLPTAIHGKFKRYEGLLTFLNYGVLYFLVLQTFTDFKRLSLLSKTITLAGAFVSLYGIMQYVGLDPLPWATLPFEERRSFSTFGNPDLLAGFLVILVPFAVAEFLKARDAKENALMGTSLFLALVCLLTAFTRSGWVGSAVTLVLFAVLAWRAIITKPRKLIFIGVAFLCTFIVIGVYSASTGHTVLNLVERLKSTTQITEGSAGTRIEIWKAGLHMIENKPIFGWGPDTYRLGSERYETYQYTKIGGGQTVADNAHNYVIQLTAGLGIPGAATFFIFFFIVVGVGIRYIRKLEGDDRLTYTAYITAAVGYFVHLLFGVSVSGSTGVWWLIIAAILAVTPLVRTATIELEPQILALRTATGVFVVIAAASAYFALTMYVADNSYATAITLGNQGAYDAAFANYEKAIGLYKNGRYYESYGMTLERLGMGQQDASLINRAVQIYKSAVEYEPGESDHYIFLAGAEAKMARSPVDPVVEDAISWGKKGLEIRPNGYSARLLLGNIYVYQRSYQSAFPLLRFVLDINPQDKTALALMGKTYEGLGNTAEARRYYQLLVTVDPSNTQAKTALDNLAKKQ